MDIPVFHDDQHGTAIISAAGIINAAHLTGRRLEDLKVVVNGAGAAGIACLELIKSMGVRNENVLLCDTKGVVYRGRTSGMNQWKSAHAVETTKAHPGRSAGGLRCVPGPVGQGRGDQGDGQDHGQGADHFRHGQSRSRNHAGRRQGGAARRHHRHRPQRLSQPGQQCAGLSLHLPRRPGCARQDHQRSDEDRRRRSHRRPGARGCAR